MDIKLNVMKFCIVTTKHNHKARAPMNREVLLLIQIEISIHIMIMIKLVTEKRNERHICNILLNMNRVHSVQYTVM